MRKDFISKFDVIHMSFDVDNPLTIGNGNFAFTCDITGLQTFYLEYDRIPLCTMTNLIWGKQKGEGEFPYKEYKKASNHRLVRYLTDTSCSTYEQFRDDVFKFDLFKIVFLYQGDCLKKEKISCIHQHLFLYDGKIETNFSYNGIPVFVETYIPQNHNNLQICVKTKLKGLQIKVFAFQPDSGLSGANYSVVSPYIIQGNEIKIWNAYAQYSLYFKTNLSYNGTIFDVKEDSFFILSLNQNFNTDIAMHDYFDTVKPLDTKDEELNRRMVLSLYLLKVNTLGMYPPAETGLTCNSWYGKFHLEMHLLHHLGLVRFGLASYVLPSLKWYLTLYESSKQRAAEQGYAGIRLPKMTDFRGLDTPSNIGCLLIWQMPHLFIFLDEIMKQDSHFIDFHSFIPTLIGLIDFMVDFYYKKAGKYHLDSPLIPVNENVEFTCDTPIFEECYTLHAFSIFRRWVEEYHLNYNLTKIQDILENYVPLEVKDGCYEAFQGCHNTYNQYNHDHPMMVGMYSYFKSEIVNPKIIQTTLHKILDCWAFEDTWGWDFPLLALTANRLNDKILAIQILKMSASKNQYLKNGHNPQYPKESLPVYLPGNGAFLLAISHIFQEKEHESK